MCKSTFSRYYTHAPFCFELLSVNHNEVLFLPFYSWWYQAWSNNMKMSQIEVKKKKLYYKLASFFFYFWYCQSYQSSESCWTLCSCWSMSLKPGTRPQRWTSGCLVLQPTLPCDDLQTRSLAEGPCAMYRRLPPASDVPADPPGVFQMCRSDRTVEGPRCGCHHRLSGWLARADGLVQGGHWE